MSGLLQKSIEEELKKVGTGERLPFFISREALEKFNYTKTPVSASAISRKINYLDKEDIQFGKMRSLSQSKITQWMLDIGMIEFREWEDGKMKRFPT